MAVLFNRDQHAYRDIIRLDLTTMETVEYVVDNPVANLRVTADGQFAVATLKPSTEWDHGGLQGYQSSRWGLAVADLSSDDIVSLVLESEPVGVELIEESGTHYALVLLKDLDEVLQVELAAPGEYGSLQLPSPPAGISANPSGGFTIAHQSALGQISFLNPSDGELETTGGFAVYDFFKEDLLPRRMTAMPNEG